MSQTLDHEARITDFLQKKFSDSEPFGPTSAEQFDPSEDHELKALEKLFTADRTVAARLMLKPKVLFGRRGSGKTSALMHSLSGSNYAVIVYAQQQMWRGVYELAKARFEGAVGPSIEEASDIWREVFRSLILEAWVRKVVLAGRSEHISGPLGLLVKAIEDGSHPNRPGVWRTRLRNVSTIFDAVFHTDTAKAVEAGADLLREILGLPVGLLWEKFENEQLKGTQCAIRLNSSEQYDFTDSPVLISGLLHFIAAPELDSSNNIDFQIALPTEHVQSFERLSASPLADFSNRAFLQWSCNGLVQLAAQRYSIYLMLHHNSNCIENFDVSDLSVRPGTN